MATLKKIFRYWCIVFKQAANAALVESELKNWIRLSLIAAVGAGVVFLLGKTNIISPDTPVIGDAISNVYLQGVLGIGSAVVFAVSFFFALVYVPADLYEKQGGFAENPFRVEIYPPNNKIRHGERRRFSVEINNTMQNRPIKNCLVRLDDVFDAKNKKQPERIQKYLMWNADVGEENQCKPHDISGGGRVVCDVVIEDGPTTVYYLIWNAEKLKKVQPEPGEWVLCLTIFGDWNGNSKPFRYYCNMMVENNYEVSLSDMKEGKYISKDAANK